MTVDQFVRNVIESGLMMAPEVHDYLGTFPPEKRPGDAESLARAMVGDRRLTKYQAGRLLSGDVKSLVFGEYTVTGKLGEGGMGQVFKAHHRRMERLAAIKVLTAATMDSQDAIKRFRQEVRVAAQLSHPNIVTTYDAGETNGQQYLIMEYVEGRDLATVVGAQGQLPLAQAIECILQAARGLEYAHARGVVHRDIKPGNLLLAADGTIKILDFGLARIDEPQHSLPEGATLAERLTQRGQMLGTVDYISPEQATDTRSADQRSDIYSLGCTLYRLVTARPMYEGKTAIAKLMCHYEAAIPSLSEASEKVSPLLEQVFRKMVAKAPEARYQSMSEVIADLEACLNAEEAVVRETVMLTPTASRSEDFALPGDVTIVQAPTTSQRSERTPPAAGDALPLTPPDAVRPADPRPRSLATVAATNGEAGEKAVQLRVKQQTFLPTLADTAEPEMLIETKVSPKEKTVGPDAKTSCELAQTGSSPAGEEVAEHRTLPRSTATLLICTAVAGALLGGLIAVGLWYVLSR